MALTSQQTSTIHQSNLILITSCQYFVILLVTLKYSFFQRHPKMDLNKNDLLRLLSYLEGELQARDITIAALKVSRSTYTWNVWVELCSNLKIFFFTQIGLDQRKRSWSTDNLLILLIPGMMVVCMCGKAGGGGWGMHPRCPMQSIHCIP